MCMCIVTFRVLDMSVLAVAKHVTNAVAQKCKVLICLSKCALVCRCKYQIKGHHILRRL